MRKVKLFLAIVLLGSWSAGSVYLWNTYAFPPKVKTYEVRVPRVVDLEEAISKRNPEVDPQIVSLIAKEAKLAAGRYDIEPSLPVAIMGAESDYRPTTQASPNPKHPDRGYGVGIMQANPVAWPELFKGVPRAKWFHLGWNINTGCKILSHCLTKKGSMREALIAYSGGSAEYADKVMGHYAQMQWDAK